MSQKISTELTRTLGIRHPIIQGGMMWISRPELVAAVSNAGALGILTALTFETSEGLRNAIRQTRELTTEPFGVNLTFLPTLKAPDYPAFIEVIVDEGVKIVETAGRNPEEFMEQLKSGQVTVIHKCTSIRFARKARDIGCDMISIDGFECAGHPGEDDVTSLVLVPRAAEELDLPVIASGGFADGRGLVAALALGASGINMGTRFLATKEAPVHPAIKQRLVDAEETETALVMRTLRNTERVLRNQWAEKVLEKEKSGAGLAELAPLLSGKNGLKAIIEGDTELGLLAAGQCTGLIHDIPSTAEMVDRIVSDAVEILSKKLPAMLTPATE